MRCCSKESHTFIALSSCATSDRRSAVLLFPAAALAPGYYLRMRIESRGDKRSSHPRAVVGVMWSTHEQGCIWSACRRSGSTLCNLLWSAQHEWRQMYNPCSFWLQADSHRAKGDGGRSDRRRGRPTACWGPAASVTLLEVRTYTVIVGIQLVRQSADLDGGFTLHCALHENWRSCPQPSAPCGHNQQWN